MFVFIIFYGVIQGVFLRSLILTRSPLRCPTRYLSLTFYTQKSVCRSMKWPASECLQCALMLLLMGWTVQKPRCSKYLTASVALSAPAGLLRLAMPGLPCRFKAAAKAPLHCWTAKAGFLLFCTGKKHDWAGKGPPNWTIARYLHGIWSG